MAGLVWGLVGEKYYETGVDRGVLYPLVGDGVAWNGLISVSETPSGGEPRPYYLDGFKYLNLATAEEFAATIEAFSSPREFDRCDGTASIHNGLFITDQRRESFGFSYRTLIGNDVDGLGHGYKIHLVYNALASPTERNYSTIGDSTVVSSFSWEISTAPLQIPGMKPTAHFVIDSRKTPFSVLTLIEAILYGSMSKTSHLPSVDELMDIFESYINLKSNLIEEGVYAIYETDVIADATAIMSDTAPKPLANGEPILWLDSSVPGYSTLKLVTGS